MTQYIEQTAGNLDGIIIDRGDSWKTTVTFDFNISAYTKSAYIKFGSNTIVLTITVVDNYNITLSLSASDSALITTTDNELILRMTYLTESRQYIKCLFKVNQ